MTALFLVQSCCSLALGAIVLRTQALDYRCPQDSYLILLLSFNDQAQTERLALESDWRAAWPDAVIEQHDALHDTVQSAVLRAVTAELGKKDPCAAAIGGSIDWILQRVPARCEAQVTSMHSSRTKSILQATLSGVESELT